MRFDKLLNKSCRVFLILLFSLLFSAPAIYCQDGSSEKGIYFVVPKAEVPVRKGKGLRYRILEVVKDGTKVELIERDGVWSMIRLPDSVEGWIPSRFLSAEEPPDKQLKALRQKTIALKGDLESARRAISISQERLKKCQKEKEECAEKKATLLNNYNMLKEDSKNVVALRVDLEKQALDLERLKKEVTVLKQENSELKSDQNVKWFLAGGGVLFLGWIIGFFLGSRGKRRPSLLY